MGNIKEESNQEDKGKGVSPNLPEQQVILQQKTESTTGVAKRNSEDNPAAKGYSSGSEEDSSVASSIATDTAEDVDIQKIFEENKPTIEELAAYAKNTQNKKLEQEGKGERLLTREEILSLCSYETKNDRLKMLAPEVAARVKPLLLKYVEEMKTMVRLSTVPTRKRTLEDPRDQEKKEAKKKKSLIEDGLKFPHRGKLPLVDKPSIQTSSSGHFPKGEEDVVDVKKTEAESLSDPKRTANNILLEQLALLKKNYEESTTGKEDVNLSGETRSGKKREIGVLTFSPDETVIPRKSDSTTIVNTENLKDLITQAVSNEMQANTMEEPFFSVTQSQRFNVDPELLSLATMPMIDLEGIISTGGALEQFVNPFTEDKEKKAINAEKPEAKSLSNSQKTAEERHSSNANGETKTTISGNGRNLSHSASQPVSTLSSEKFNEIHEPLEKLKPTESELEARRKMKNNPLSLTPEEKIHYLSYEKKAKELASCFKVDELKVVQEELQKKVNSAIRKEVAKERQGKRKRDEHNDLKGDGLNVVSEVPTKKRKAKDTRNPGEEKFKKQKPSPIKKGLKFAFRGK